MVTPLSVLDYLPVDHERKLAAALAPVVSSVNISGTGISGGAEAVTVSEEEFLEAATAGELLLLLCYVVFLHVQINMFAIQELTHVAIVCHFFLLYIAPSLSPLLTAAVLAGKKRGRPRSNPLPILTTAHLLGSGGGSGSSAVGSDGASVTSGDGGECIFLFVREFIEVLKNISMHDVTIESIFETHCEVLLRLVLPISILAPIFPSPQPASA